VSLRELRQVCQLPVRGRNDVAGLVYGDLASLPITKVFVDLGISPTVASVGFLLAGLVGSALQVGSGWMAVAGSLCLLLYYVLDCVDGEVARYREIEDVRWAYFDYLFHMLVKPLAFLGVGVGTFRLQGEPWLLVAAFSAGVATLWLKIFLATPGIVFLRAILPDGTSPLSPAPEEPPAEAGAATGSEFPLGLNVTTLRALMTNFDIGLPLLLAASVLDLFVGPFELPVVGVVSLRVVWLLYYAVVLPIDFVDYVRSYLAAGHFAEESRRLARLAHRFRADG
jgi:hypothetical protein